MDIKIVEKFIDDNMVDDLVLYSKSLSLDGYMVLIEYLINKLMSYSIPNEINKRNSVALALGDLKCNEAVPKIIELLKKDGESLYVGTLVYVLKNLDCVYYLEQIFHLLHAGNYEVRRTMFTLLKENIEKTPLEIRNKMQQALKKAIEEYKDKLSGLYAAQNDIFNIHNG